MTKAYTHLWNCTTEMFASVAKLNTVEILLSTAANQLNHFEVKKAFLNGYLEEECKPS